MAIAAGIVAARAADERGQLDLRDIDLSEPTLTALLQHLLLPPQRISDAHQTVKFYRLRLDFQRSPEQLVIRSGVACNEDFAATIDGYATLPAGDLHFKGVLWPAMEPTGIAGAPIPIVSNLAKRTTPNAPLAPHRGVFPVHDPNFVPFGLSYALAGRSAAPILRINPFADEYPGDLRRIAETCGGN
jgi:hypothetical protein